MDDDRCIPELLICESPVSEVYGSEYDRIFTVRSKLFNKDFVARAYTSMLNVNPDGSLDLDINWKDGRKREVRKPFHFLKDGVLYAMKIFKHNRLDAFALNHELFALDWHTSVILHFFENEPFVFMASRGEWLSSSIPGQQNEELQVFMQVPDYRRLDMSVIPASGKEWAEHCVEYKRAR